jgi:hypothetical protein
MLGFLSRRWLPAQSLPEMMAMVAVAGLLLCLLIWLRLM